MGVFWVIFCAGEMEGGVEVTPARGADSSEGVGVGRGDKGARAHLTKLPLGGADLIACGGWGIFGGRGGTDAEARGWRGGGRARPAGAAEGRSSSRPSHGPRARTRLQFMILWGNSS